MKHAALRPGLVFDLARVTIEFTTPCLVSSGDGDGLYDAVFVADANGLPALPGETLAGVLRHALADGKNPDEDPLCRLVFGYQQRDQGEASALRVSWAQVHGADDRPVPFRGDAAKLAADPVLALLRRGVARDHVRIGPHGAVDGRGKFDEQLVPAGARFTSELVFDRAAETDAAPLPTLEALMAVLARPELRLGRSGRRGLGGFVVRRVLARHFDLQVAADYAAYQKLPVALEDGDGGQLRKVDLPKGVVGPGWVHGSVSLQPVGTFRFSGSVRSGHEPKVPVSSKEARSKSPLPPRDYDRFPLTEQRIRWNGQGKAGVRDQGVVVPSDEAEFLAPGSGLKGALRHRTAFHLRRLEKVFAPAQGSLPVPLPATPREELIFGATNSNEGGAPGKLLVADAWIAKNAAKYLPQQHVSLDRFTGGPMDGLLFDELSLGQSWLQLRLDLQVAGLDRVARRALAAALDDLTSARLQVGAGRGHGRFRGTVIWSDQGRWLEEGGEG